MFRPAFVAMFTVVAFAQTGSESASELIRSLSKPRSKGQPIIIVFRCGLVYGPLRERQTAKELVQLGKTAIPDIERALDSIERKDRESSLYQNAEWLLFAYARILGPAATARLQRVRNNPKLANSRVDDALALSLGLTSYVSATALPSASSGCRRRQPKDGLDELVRSLETGDLTKLQESLGPDGRNALDQALKARSPEATRREIWHLPPGVNHAIGYRFEIEGPWSEPEETIEQPRNEYQGPLLMADRFSIETQFTDKVGKNCGLHKVDFRRVETISSVSTYRINNTDMEDLLRVIGRCAVE